MKNNSNYLIFSRVVALAMVFSLVVTPVMPAAHALAEEASTTPEATTPVDQDVANDNAADVASETDAAASTGSNEATSTGADAVVATGDAAAAAESENDVNTNLTDSSAPGLPETLNASTTPETASTTPVDDLTVEDTNTATTTSTTTASADTGDNTAAATGGSAEVYTGDAYATANSINVVNTNIIGSAGLIYFRDLFAALGIDLRSLDLSYFSGGAGSGGCSLTSCGDTTVTTNNAATTTSAVTVVADTGGNTASSTDGTATVATGNAYASGNSVNLVNTNIVKSNYLLVGVNEFGDLGGDITLPGASFFEQLLARAAGARVEASTTNTATVSASTTATASTGGNEATSTDGTATVVTGNALSSATSINQVNTNQVGGSQIFFLFRIWGDWSGTVTGLPAGMSWRETPLGVEIVSDSAAPSTGLGEGAIDASTTNDANVTSNVNVYALTGDNQATGQEASVTTGNAYASANSVNIVNTNIIGSNWMYAIFNIFGNFSGDISFGRPDLWIGATAEAGNPTDPNTQVPFHFTVANKGDAAATNVHLALDFTSGMLSFASGAGWDLGDFAPGEVKDFTYEGTTGTPPAGYSAEVPITATVTSDEADNNPDDNTDHLALIISNPLLWGGSGGGTSFTSDPEIEITKVANETATTAPATIDYTVEIRNRGGRLYDAVALDTLRGPTGEVVSTQQFNLGTIEYHDGARITYSVVFDENTEPGTYTNTVTVTGRMHYPSGEVGSVALSPVSTTNEVTILDPQSIKNAESTGLCPEYLTKYIKPGAQNDPEQVKLLQAFLMDSDAGAGVSITGEYDAATIAAVDRFQQKYASDVLDPWGYNRPTSFVYYTTRKKINDLYCSGLRTFGLSEEQLAEIARTRTLVASIRDAAVHQLNPAALGASGAASTTTATTTSGEVILPEGIEIGLAEPAPDAERSSWLARVLNGPRLFMASVLSAFSSATDGPISLR